MASKFKKRFRQKLQQKQAPLGAFFTDSASDLPDFWGLGSNGTVNAVKRSFKVANNKATTYSIPSGKRIDGHSWTGARQIDCMLR
ncbi:TPA: hypothetical protein MEA92_004845 [Klebsiella aerogenes]|uniref:hypothetical protein n=1 Tax=Klebsiella aerogenes TaxID=548 RepID=UPI00103ADFBB|nr:hypothetical protein [Klebsiella aerogenes]HBV9945977.1 hypothetical protein [Klebsiella aerogenes]